MKFTITHPMHRHPYNPELVSGEGIAEVAAAAEAAGIHGFGFTDHPAPSQRWLEAGGHDALDPFVAMGYAAARTTTLRLIPNIVVLPYRNPFVVAKSGATLDLLSGGRFTLAVGVGYLKREFAALGVDFEERAALFDEALDVIRAIWTTDDVDLRGHALQRPRHHRASTTGERSASADLDRRQHRSRPATGRREGRRMVPFRGAPRVGPDRAHGVDGFRWKPSPTASTICAADSTRPDATPRRSTSSSAISRAAARPATTSTPTRTWPAWNGWPSSA